MSGANHVIGGIVWTGIWGGLVGVNILSSPWYLFTCVLGSLIPDIDRPGSIITRIPGLLKLSKWINVKYGHRTITHSLIAFVVAISIVRLLQIMFVWMESITTVFALGFLSHLVFDMMTVAGVPLFYPWKKNPCVLPAKPELRFRTSNVRSEAMIFCTFIVMFIFFQPLMSNGFWTQYNRSFGTLKHLSSEFQKQEKLIEVDYEYREASTKFLGKGFVIESLESKATLLVNGDFKFLDNTKMQDINVYPTTTNREFSFINKTFINVSPDSMNRLLVDSLIMEIDLNANNEFRFSTGGTGTKFRGKYLKEFFIDEVFLDKEYSLENYESKTNPRIKTLEKKLQRLEADSERFLTDLKIEKKIISDLKLKLEQETDLYEREKLIADIKEREKHKQVSDDVNKILDLKEQIRELNAKDLERNKEGRREAARRNQEIIDKNRSEPTRFTGIVKYLSITN